MANNRDAIDRVLLHQFLWKYRARNDFLDFRTGELAEKLGVTIYTMSTILGQLVSDGRLKRIGSKYVVIDPSLCAWTPRKVPDESEQPSMF